MRVDCHRPYEDEQRQVAQVPEPDRERHGEEGQEPEGGEGGIPHSGSTKGNGETMARSATTRAKTTAAHGPADFCSTYRPNERAAPQSNAAPMSAPWPGSMCTKGAKSQNPSGPGSPVVWTPPAPVAAPVPWPTNGACRLNVFHAWSAMEASSPTGSSREPWCARSAPGARSRWRRTARSARLCRARCAMRPPRADRASLPKLPSRSLARFLRPAGQRWLTPCTARPLQRALGVPPPAHPPRHAAACQSSNHLIPFSGGDHKQAAGLRIRRISARAVRSVALGR